MTARAIIHIDDDAVTLIADDDILAVRQYGWVEVWSADGETHMGNLPEYVGETEIRFAAAFWLNGFAAGVSFGRDEAQAKLREALGIGS